MALLCKPGRADGHSKHASGSLVVVSGLAIGFGKFVSHDRITPEGLFRSFRVKGFRLGQATR
jgi:hypothetical protein